MITCMVAALGFAVIPAAAEEPVLANCPDSDQILEFVEPETAARGVACVWYSGESMRQPIIIPDGFDPGDTRDHMGIYDIIGEKIYSTLSSEGYDIVILNFDSGAGYIQDNAQILRQLIVRINDEISTDDDIVVIGTSIAGLISRHALASMEDAGEDHNTRLFISFDSPQLGATVPLGNQYFLRYVSSIMPLAEYYLNQELYTPSGKQILLYHESHAPGTVGSVESIYNVTMHVNNPQPDPLFVDLQGELEKLGYPENLRKVAISNGDGYGNGQGLANGGKMVEYENDSLLLTISINTYALTGGSAASLIFEGMADPIGETSHQFDVYIQNALPYDGAPGGWRATSQLFAGDAGGLYCTAGGCLVDLGVIVARAEHENYIPTHSALGIELSLLGNDPYANIDALYKNNTSITPFDAIYYPLGNQRHVEITSENEKWFLCEIFANNPVAYQRHCPDGTISAPSTP